MILKVITSFIAGSLIAYGAFGAVSKRSSDPTNWVPYPWAQELPFTWSTAQGVWVAGDDTLKSYFYVRVSRDTTSRGVKYLTIVEKDGQTCEAIATGFGTEHAGTRIYAVMKFNNGQRYSMILRQYDPKGLPDTHDVYPLEGKVMVLTIMHKGSRKTYNYPMRKISDRTEYSCVPEK